MMKPTFLSFAISFVFLIAYVACKKTESSSRNDSLILGQWELTNYGVDTNNNNVLDKNESTPVSGFSKLFVFYETGDYNAISMVGFSKDTVRGQWSLLDNGQVLQTVSGGDTAKFTIHTLTSTNLSWIVQTASGSVPYWQVFKKN